MVTYLSAAPIRPALLYLTQPLCVRLGVQSRFQPCLGSNQEGYFCTLLEVVNFFWTLESLHVTDWITEVRTAMSLMPNQPLSSHT